MFAIVKIWPSLPLLEKPGCSLLAVGIGIARNLGFLAHLVVRSGCDMRPPESGCVASDLTDIYCINPNATVLMIKHVSESIGLT
jgi:hypothetical protein